MGLVLLLVVLGISIFAAVFYLSRMRRSQQQFNATLAEPVIPVNLVDNENAVVVAEGRGHLPRRPLALHHHRALLGEERVEEHRVGLFHGADQLRHAARRQAEVERDRHRVPHARAAARRLEAPAHGPLGAPPDGGDAAQQLGLALLDDARPRPPCEPALSSGRRPQPRSSPESRHPRSGAV